jgi:serine/threonine protein kinase
MHLVRDRLPASVLNALHGKFFSIAHYRITAKLGEGGMGEVCRVTDTKLNREVAVKARTRL